MSEKLLFEKSVKGRRGAELPDLDVPAADFSENERRLLRKKSPVLPELCESDVIRHYIKLSNLNHHIDKGFYPLGSCTMKYNPKINEEVARFSGLSGIHPLQDPGSVQGALRLMAGLEKMLMEITGMDAVTLQPAAGAQGELTGLLLIRAFHESRGNPRKTVIIPDSAHGTNPASVTLAGYTVKNIQSNEDGILDCSHLEGLLDEDVAAIMITNPNTLGIFEEHICRITSAAHRYGAKIYMDGANLNALLGIARPGDMGVDAVHINLHKTFSTPHGGGGPGAGPVAVKSDLAPFLPVPLIKEKQGVFELDFSPEKSIGKLQNFWGNFGVMIRAYTYIMMHGGEGLKNVSRDAIINANYLLALLKDHYDLPYKRRGKHEFVLSGTRQKKSGVKTLDIAKRLLDYGFHAPTIYFPLIVEEALMIEPTETESKETLEAFAQAMINISMEVLENPEKVKNAPETTPVKRLDELGAARNPDLRWKP